MKHQKIPNAVFHRIPMYYRYLEQLQVENIDKISSTALAVRIGLTPSQIRQDLSYFGEFGRQGYGYGVTTLKNEIAEILGMNKGYTAVVLGAGHLARALVSNLSLESYGITVTGFYDIAPEVVGCKISEIPVYHINQLESHLAKQPVDIGVFTMPPDAAPELAITLAKAGAKGIWNFTNVDLKPKNQVCVIENVHLFDSLFSLCCKVKSGNNVSCL